MSKRLRSQLRQGDSTCGSAHLANHTCCPQYRNAELQILSVWQGDWESQTPQGPCGGGAGARNPEAPDRTEVATLRATKPIQKGMPVLTCYRNISSAGTASQLIRERETLNKMFRCACCLCKGPWCTLKAPPLLSPPPLPDPEVLVLEGVDSNPRSATETAGQLLRQDRHRNVDPEIPAQERSNELGGNMPPPVVILPTPMQLKWNSSADKRKNSRLKLIGNKPTQRSRPSDLARSRMDSFFRPPSRPSPQV
mmetsp:Transcript_64885/g.95017  ORF Transcript_64885/g.95017 Transcript_64885/m.95017 type:complete len:252 (-) Transcript_64885:1063-1818(-)